MSFERKNSNPLFRKAGFTLLEVMVALAVFALAASALMVVDGSAIRQAVHVRNAVFASQLAEEVMKKILIDPNRPHISVKTETRRWAGKMWQVETDFQNAELPSFYRVVITVRSEDRLNQAFDGTYAYQLFGYVRENESQ